MDSFLLRYKKEVLNNPEEFINREHNKFPLGYTDEDKVKSEYIKIHTFYFDKSSNEAYFDSNQTYVIFETFNEIDDLIEQEEYEIAKYYIVSLELLIGIEVKFYKVLYEMIQNKMSISDFVDKERYLGTDDPYTNDNTKKNNRRI